MSGTLNPLATRNGVPVGPGSPQNPLAAPSGQQQPDATPVPQGPLPVAAAQQQIAQAGPGPADLVQGLQRMNYITRVLGSLLGDKNVTRKDVVKATADAVGAQHFGAERAIKFISGMPDDPKELRPWLQNLYHSSLVSSVAMYAHAHQMVGAAPAAAPAVVPQGAVTGPIAMPGGQAA